MSKLKFPFGPSKNLRKIFAAIILSLICFIAFESKARAFFAKEQLSKNIQSAKLQDALKNPYPAPEISGIKSWLNSKPLTISSLKGKVVLIDFWTYSCINCLRTLPYITKWDQTYRDKGLIIIGIHAPEFEFEKNADNVQNAIKRNNVKYPVALDNNLDTWRAFQNKYWPAHYLIDKDGNVVYTHFGEGNYDKTENNIRYLLGLDAKNEKTQEQATYSYSQTPETYLGSLRAENFSNPKKLINATSEFKLPQSLPADNWALSGRWKIDSQKITSQESNAKLQLNFTSKKVFLVLGTQSSKPIIATVKLNGIILKKFAGKDVVNGKIEVSGHRLYELINQDSVKNGLLEITSSEEGLEAYAFTFGS